MLADRLEQWALAYIAEGELKGELKGKQEGRQARRQQFPIWKSLFIKKLYYEFW
ncbi:MAG: hypothetical protein WCG16_12490 [Methylococcales bacterium]